MAIIAHGSELQATPHIDGRRLRHLNVRKRGELAVNLTKCGHGAKAAAKACGVSLSTVYRVYRELNPQAPKPSPAYIAHADWWKTARFSERVDFVHACGEGEIWDALAVAVA
jgi:transposase